MRRAVGEVCKKLATSKLCHVGRLHDGVNMSRRPRHGEG
jgi:hypothetical protein